MKIIGVFNPCGFNPLTEKTTWPLNLFVVYLDNEGKYYTKFLDSGDLALLLAKFESNLQKTTRKKEIEVECYLNQGVSIFGLPHKYSKIKNEFYYKQLPEDNTCYCALQEFPKDKVTIESEFEEDPQTFTTATLFPDKNLYIGSREFIYQNATPHLKIEEKSVEEIEGIIHWLIETMHLEEAYNIINRIKSSGNNLDEYKHPKNLFVTDGSDNFLDQQLNRIEALEFVKEKTKTLNLKMFSK